MTNWKADLDALIDETMAFAKRIHVATPMPRTIVEQNRMPPLGLFGVGIFVAHAVDAYLAP